MWLLLYVLLHLSNRRLSPGLIPSVMIKLIRAVGQRPLPISRMKCQGTIRIEVEYRNPPVQLTCWGRVPCVAVRVNSKRQTRFVIAAMWNGFETWNVDIGFLEVAAEVCQ